MSQKQIFFMMISVQADEGVAQKDFLFFFKVGGNEEVAKEPRM